MKTWNFGIWAALFLGLLGWNSCSTSKNVTNLDNLDKVVEMKKGPCYGRCPVFTLTIYENGLASYQGERFTNKQGLYTKNISKSDVESLKTAFKKADFWNFDNVYKSKIPDLQTVTIVWHEEGDSKSVMGKDGRPAKVMELEDMLEGFANSDGWILQEKPQTDLPDGTIADELIVQLKQGVDIYSWATKYAKQDMRVLRNLTTNGSTWVVSFDNEAVESKQMLVFVQNDDEVINAQFNKKNNGKNN